MNRRKNRRFRASVFTLTCLLVSAGCCSGQSRSSTVQAPSGIREKLPLDVPIRGTTTRQQVEEHYKAFAVDSGIPSLFWGRFRKSRWAILEAGGRTWDTYNLLVTFDADGIVRSCETVPDKKLFPRFRTMYREKTFPPLDLSQPLQVDGRTASQPRISINLQLSHNRMLVTMPKPSRISSGESSQRETSAVPVTQISAINNLAWEVKQVSEIPIELRFSQKTALGRYFYFSAEPSGALTLVRWMEQVKQQEK